MSRTVPTVIVGTSTLLREGLSAILAPLGFRVVASKTSLSEIGPEDFPAPDPCLLIIECSHDAGRLIPQITALKQQTHHIRIALLGRHWQPPEIAAAFYAGANAYFAEATASDEFVRAIELIMMGHQAVLPVGFRLSPPEIEADGQSRVHLLKAQEVDQRKLVGVPTLHLSPREISILRCLARGAPNKLIAREIKISEATVKVHIKAILRKIGVANRTQAAIWATTNPDLIVEHSELPNLALAREPAHP
jgi:two-component system, NarL family, nitrate/nitrite response regulator NarL